MFDKLVQQRIGIFIEFQQFCGRICVAALEVISGPLDGMFDLIREVFQSTKWDSLLWWVDDIVVAHGVMRDDDLRVAFGT